MSVVTDGEIGPEGSQEALESGDEASSRREEKGKAVVNVKDLITVRARLSDGSKDVNVQVDKGDSVRVLGRKLSDKKVRLVYMGKILKETSTLPDQGWKRGNIVNALEKLQETPTTTTACDGDGDGEQHGHSYF
ncbi:hypothetical protein SMACR_07344 [Sordaria macrospora]|nr:hypothetical protein SMACR_07344 [Sordaria macrospora]